MDILLLVGLGALLIFFMFNSRKKQQARMRQISDNLVPGVEVMTTFGVYGTVVAVDTEKMEVTLESGPGTVLRVHRQAIGQIQTPVEAAPADPALGEDTAAREDAGPVVDTAPDAPAGADAADAPVEDTPAETAEEAERRRITDAELDAINEARRREQSTPGSEASPETAVDADADADTPRTDIDGTTGEPRGER